MFSVLAALPPEHRVTTPQKARRYLPILTEQLRLSEIAPLFQLLPQPDVVQVGQVTLVQLPEHCPMDVHFPFFLQQDLFESICPPLRRGACRLTGASTSCGRKPKHKDLLFFRPDESWA